MQTINGKFIQNLPTTSGESQRGTWVRGGFVIEYGEEYPRKVAFTTFGEDKVAQHANIPSGTPVQVKFAPESREFNERWYTDLRAISVTPLVQGTVPASMPTAAPAPMPAGIHPQGQPISAGQQTSAFPAAAPAAVQYPANFQAQPAAQPVAKMPDDPENDLPF